MEGRPEDTSGGDLGFAFRVRKSGEVEITRGGRLVTLLRGEAARSAVQKLAAADEPARQQLLARLTGHYRQGNERTASGHPRNR